MTKREFHALLKKFLGKFQIGEDEEFTYGGDEHKYKMHNGELMVYYPDRNEWCYAEEDTKRYIADKILLSETRSRKIFGGA